MGSGRHSPAMQQFFRAKQQYPDAIVFFRMGDFYEMFFEDAVLASKLLDIALTSRGTDSDGAPIPMAGVPHHAAASYVARLLEQGQRVAICEQMEDPSKVKGLVPREVVRVITPGLVVDSDALDARTHNYLAAVVKRDGRYGLAALELSTAEMRACQAVSQADLLAELVSIDPREVLYPEGEQTLAEQLASLLVEASFRPVTDQQLEAAGDDKGIAEILERAAVERDIQAMGAEAMRAAAMVLGYAQQTQPGTVLDVQRIAVHEPGDRLMLDEACVRNLEVVRSLSGERKGSLLHLLDMTETAMGARALRRRLLEPLRDLGAIRRRHDAVDALVRDAGLRGQLRGILAGIGDLERLATRAALAVATPRDLGAIRDSLASAAVLARSVFEKQERSTDDSLCGLTDADLCQDVFESLCRALQEQPPVIHTAGGIFLDSFDSRVGELRNLSSSSKDVILELEQRERERTGISSLRIRYTRVFGYYIEVTKAHLSAVPADYRRKQTVATAERYTTEELETVQAQILSADERLRALEAELFTQLRAQVGMQAHRIRALAAKIADLDVHAALAEGAHRFGYVRPHVDESWVLDLKDGRHPLVERMLKSGQFVPNDVYLEADGKRLMVITGPNMAGKSTVMRQVALAVIMAQAGGFVPASEARIGLVDRIYTRVGATDNLAYGQSTFMVEMRETADILLGATRRSLVVLDEIGRGTSTYDGVAIAWAVAEYLYDAVGCRAMFATHYHELCDLAATREGVVNFNVAAREFRNDVVFLRKLIPGGANRSYGVAVAKLAGVPAAVLARAKGILKQLEAGAALPSGGHASMRARTAEGAVQLDMFAPLPSPPPAASPPSELETALHELDLEHLTPVEALLALSQLKSMLPEGPEGE